MLKFTSIVGYTSCGPRYIESFFTIFGQCINVSNYNCDYMKNISACAAVVFSMKQVSCCEEKNDEILCVISP